MTSAIVPTYSRYDLAFERGEGAWLVATNGERYLDFGAGIAVASLGYTHPHLVQALTTQANKLTTTEFLCQYIHEAVAKAAREGALGADGKGLAKIRVTLHETDLARAFVEGPITT